MLVGVKVLLTPSQKRGHEEGWKSRMRTSGRHNLVSCFLHLVILIGSSTMADSLAQLCAPGSRMMVSVVLLLLNYGSDYLKRGGSKAPFD